MVMQTAVPATIGGDVEIEHGRADGDSCHARHCGRHRDRRSASGIERGVTPFLMQNHAWWPKWRTLVPVDPFAPVLRRFPI